MEYKRILNLSELLAKKSFFLFGPRATGKTYLIKKNLGTKVQVINLLRGDLYLRLSESSSELENIIEAGNPDRSIVVIDEIQRIPELLNEVHRLIEEKHICFLLTGSSARKLRHGGANLLGGRAWNARLFPLCWREIPDFKLGHYLRYGGLPPVQNSDYPAEELSAYVETYLHEEIEAEGLVRKLPRFSRFLKIAGLMNGQLLNYSAVASDAGLPTSTVKDYFQILDDTLLGFSVEPWKNSKKRKAITTAKHYLFDTGVTHAITGTQKLDRNSDLYGRSFEQWVAMELRAYLSYRRIRKPLEYWRSTSGYEVDFLLGTQVAIEVKASRRISSRDLRGLNALKEEGVVEKMYVVSRDQIEAVREEIHCIPWNRFMELLWTDKIIS